MIDLKRSAIPKDLSKMQPGYHGEFHCALCHCGLLKCICAYGHHNAPIRTEMCGCYRSKSEPAPETKCEDCHGTGEVCVGTSGLDSDGNAPVMERCPTCGYSESEPDVAQK